MKIKMIITETKEDANCIKEIDFIKKDFYVVSPEKQNRLTEKQINDIKKLGVNEIIMFFSTVIEQQIFYNTYKGVLPNTKFSFIYYLNNVTISSIINTKGNDFIKELLNNKVTATL